MLLSNMLEGVCVKETIGDMDTDISGINFNSLKIKKGDVFVAVKGYSTDGHKYIDAAVAAGAAAVVVEDKRESLPVPQIVVSDSREALAVISANFYGNPTKKFKLIGITGTNGKTSITYLLKTILEKTGHKVGLIGTNQNMVGSMVLKAERTTPESMELQELFAIMAREGVDHVVMEVSSHSLELKRVFGCHFDIGAFTNLTQDHLDFHKTIENYRNAKAKLFKMCDIGIVNLDDEHAEKLMQDASCKVVSYGTKDGCDIKAENISLHERGVEFDAAGERFFLGIPGEFSVYNALCAIGIAMSLGIDKKDISGALRCASGVKGRAEIVDVPTDYTVMIDYAHTPDGLENILNTVRGFCKGRLITVFGCGGDRDSTKRPIMGEVAGNLSDFCVVTSDNPRSEDPGKIIDDIMVGVEKTGAAHEVIENRKKAIEYALSIAKANDIVLLAGKGHETYQILKSGVIDFDERKIVKEILGVR
jgi:UDP-N-acetylmuramoyl-L-alanyl-D-glutamate--2,6-diaminopimelate ligase